MPTQSPAEQALLAEIVELRARLDEAEETLRAIHSGEIDALVIETSAGSQIFTLQGQDAELNRFLGEILAQISDAVIVVDDDNRVTYLNAAAAQQYGMSASEALGRLVTEIYQCRWLQPGDEATMMAALSETDHWRGENIHIKRNGEVIHVECSVTRLHVGNGNHSGLLAVIRDITERILAERSIRESEQRIRLATEATGVGIWERNLITNNIRWDAQMFRIYGIAPSTDGLVPYTTWTESVLPEDLPQQEKMLQETIRLGRNTREFRIRRAGGRECRYIQAVEMVRMNAQGQPEWLVGTNLDVTDRTLAEIKLRESEERWRFALQVSNLGAWELNLANRTAWRSLRHDRIFGYEELLPEWTYATFLQHVLEEDREEVDRCFQQAMAEHQDWNVECRIRRTDGAVRWIWVYGKHLGEAGECSERVFGLVEDITERKQTEQALKDADRRKDEFLAMLAHELRNPLGPMRNVAQLLKMGSLDAARISWCGDVVDRQVEHLSRLVDDLLDISRITLGKIELNKESVAVADFVLPAVEVIRPLIEARQQQFSLALPPQLVRIEGDRVRLTQVVTNLLSNAVKYTENGGHIRLTVEPHENEVCIRVCDTGCGIEPSALPNLFDLFYQVNCDIARSQGGLGIGLSLVHKLMAMHGGSVQAFSGGLGQGSQFVVRLPLLSLADTATEIATACPPSINGELRILVVDDYYAAAESLAMVLELKGHQVWIAHDGMSAIEIAQVKLPQAVILDIGLPEMGGYEVAKKLRQCPELGEMLVIALSGYTSPNDPEALRVTGFDEYLTKPVDMEKLQKLLEKCRTFNLN